jgi:hypothetical protein
VKGDEISILECNDKHYFHTECLIQNIRADNTECPLCRIRIEASMMMDDAEAPVMMEEE